MTEQPRQRRTSPFIVWPVWVSLMTIVYFLSFGPVTWFWGNDRISNEAYELLCRTVYSPLLTVYGSEYFEMNPVGRAYIDYVLWLVP